MEEEIKKLKALIESSQRILVTSHISPDPDAVSSVLLMGATLGLNYPDKQVKVALEEKPGDLGFIEGFNSIVFNPVHETLIEFKPDLFILLDGNNYERCSRQDGQLIRDYLLEKKVQTAVVDHHEVEGKDNTNIFINYHSPSTAQDVYSICFKELGLKKPHGAAQTAMTGFYADTGGFVYVKDGKQRQVFGFAEELVEGGADIEVIKNKLEAYTEADMSAVAELANNITHGGSYTYSFISDDFIKNWIESGYSHIELQRPTGIFLNNYIRNIGGRSWGFIVYKNVLQGENIYSASFRSQGGSPDVAELARALGGGGHKAAAGAKFEAKSVDEAINKVKAAISSDN
jgi:bifunctional oligoribonuclease and PAP phosphatase NrnA